MIEERAAGVLLHPTSLPGPASFGVLGADAYRFVDRIHGAGFRYWQTLPLGPVDKTLSPYQLRSVHAGNPLLVDFAAYARERASAAEQRRRRRFERDNADWLESYSLFEAISRDRGGAPWWQWPEPLRRREQKAVAQALDRYREARATIVFEQHVFDRQWAALRAYANDRGIRLLGDLPFYVDRNSVDVWCHPELFALDAAGRPTAVAGVPPDYFSADGQLWGHPLYDWKSMAAQGFDWWVGRLRHQLERFDLLRLDHFRAFESHWAVPAAAKTARDGAWVETPGDALLEAVAARLGALPFIAEDLGTITPAVSELRQRWGLPGLIVLQFAFDGSPQNPYLPRHHEENAVVYTGTHDNDTTLGWYRNLDATTRSYVAEVLGEDCIMPQALIRSAYVSPARLAVIPMQDLLGLGSEARMNVPGVAEGNWRWRFAWAQLDDSFARDWSELARAHDRLRDS